CSFTECSAGDRDLHSFPTRRSSDLWIAMEWVEGRTLRQVLADGALPLETASSITRQIADGLAAAHAKGVVHRDLKPENVMITARSEEHTSELQSRGQLVCRLLLENK